jgi:hypothetical protein
VTTECASMEAAILKLKKNITMKRKKKLHL